MRLHRFFISDLEEKLEGKREISISDKELLNQWKKVFRLEKGDKVLLLDNTGLEYEAEFELLTKDGAKLTILSSNKVGNVPKREVVLFCSLIKKDHFELVLEKGTELGVTGFVPVLSERSEKKDLNMERARKIIREASEQSGRGEMPLLGDVTELSEVPANTGVTLIAFHPYGKKFDPVDFADNKPLGVFIGPEGGWSDKEVEFFKENDIEIYSLGSQILRAETASVAISALLFLQ